MLLPFFLPPIDSWSDWSALFNDKRRWKPVIDTICRSHGFRYRRIEIPQSNTNAVFLLDRRLIVKIYSPFWSEFEVEPKLIATLAMDQAVPVPRIVAEGSFHDRVTWRYLVMEYAAGQTLDALRSEISHDDILNISRQVGRVVKALHKTEVQPPDVLDSGESWNALVNRRRRDALDELAQTQLIGPMVAKELNETLDHVLSDYKDKPQTLVHGDLESDHILLNRLGGEWKVTCLIDFGDAKIGVCDYEWMPLWFGFFDRDIQAMRAFLEIYDRHLLTDVEFPNRLIAWTLLHDFGTDAISNLLRTANVPTPVESFAELRKVCWPTLAPLSSS